MSVSEVNTELAQIALNKCQGFAFEKFVNDFMAGIEGKSFIPIGGSHDGGADASLNDLYSMENTQIFYQVSITEKHRPKIKQTIDRLIEVGRQPKRLIYITSQTIGSFDREEEEPRVVEYFQKATANFKLIVGTDMIVRALTERFLTKENQMTRNLFEMSRHAGIDLILTESALQGVLKHIIVTDNEYKNNIKSRGMNNDIENILLKESEQILIRTYYHGKLSGRSNSWVDFISGYLTYTELHNPMGLEELKSYILCQFHMSFYSDEQLFSIVNQDKVNQLAEEIVPLKNNYELAKGTSLIINSVYALRNKNREMSTYPEYGYQTWWLTQESKV